MIISADGFQSIENSVLDGYKHFEYIQVIENLLNFIRQKLEFQVRALNDFDYIFHDTDLIKIEYQYELEIDSDMLESNYFKRRCRELNASAEFNQNNLSHVLENTYLLAKTINEYYITNISEVEFDSTKKISLRYDQINGTITDILLESEFKIYTPRELAMFCNNVAVIIFDIFFQDKIVSGSYNKTGKSIPGNSNTLKTNIVIDTESLKHKNLPKNSKRKTSKENLREVWQMPPDHYEHIMSKLITEIYYKFDFPFVSQINGQYFWNISINCSRSYLSGFIYSCLLKNWILDKHINSEYKHMILNTFNITVDSSPYKAALAKAKSVNQKYLDPFKDM